MKDVDDLEDDMEGIIHDFEEKNNRTLLHLCPLLLTIAVH